MTRKGGLIVLLLVVSGFFPAWAADAAKENDRDFVYEAHGRRDPFWKLVSPTGAVLTHENDLTAADLVLEGVLAGSNGKSIAIINGRVVKENENLGMFFVQKITSDEVVLQRGQETITLKLKKED